MNYLYLLCFICVGFQYVLCAPTVPPVNTFYNAIVEKCPNLDSDANYKKEPLFKTCSNWTTISKVNKLASQNFSDIRCLLYYETFTSYCNGTLNANTTLSSSILSKYKLDDVCAYVKTITFNHLGTLFSTQNNCERICTDGLGFVDSICSASYYFAHLKHSKVEPPAEVTPSSSTNPTDQEVPQSHLLQVPHRNHSEADNKNKTGEKKQSDNEAALHKAAINTPPPVEHQQSVPQVEAEVRSVKPSVPPVVPKAPAAPVVAPNKQSTDVAPDKQSTNVDKPKTEEQLPKTLDADQDIQINDGNHGPEIVNSDTDPDDELPEDLDNESREIAPNPPLNEKNSKPLQTDDSVSYATEMDGDSYFFTYFMLLCIIFIVGYVCYHNKQKILALILEGRKGKRQYRGRRPNSANYHKLDSNLEEAINSSCKKNTNNVIY